MNYKEKECPRCNGECWLENHDDGELNKCDLCKGTGVIGWIEEVINGKIVKKK